MPTRKYRPTRGNTISAYLDAETYKAVIELATKSGRAINAIIVEAVKKYLDEKKAQAPPPKITARALGGPFLFPRQRPEDGGIENKA